MSATIELTTRCQEQIIIKLLDNAFVREFSQQLQYVIATYPIKSYRERIPPPSAPGLWNQPLVDAVQQKIRTAVQQLNCMGVKFPIPVEEIVLTPGLGRQLLNRLH